MAITFVLFTCIRRRNDSISSTGQPSNQIIVIIWIDVPLIRALAFMEDFRMHFGFNIGPFWLNKCTVIRSHAFKLGHLTPRTTFRFASLLCARPRWTRAQYDGNHSDFDRIAFKYKFHHRATRSTVARRDDAMTRLRWIHFYWNDSFEMWISTMMGVSLRIRVSRCLVSMTGFGLRCNCRVKLCEA